MGKVVPHWQTGSDYSGCPFFIRRMDTKGYLKAAEAPSASLPMVGFIYLTDGEVLVEVDGRTHLCSSGHLLVIPEQTPFVILYYRNAVGYSGGFSYTALEEGAKPPVFYEPVQQAFRSGEATFTGELFNMLSIAYDNGDQAFVGKALDLLLSRLKSPAVSTLPTHVSRFMDLVFDKEGQVLSVSGYAALLGLSSNYLGRCVRAATGRSVGSWIDISRTNRAKRLLRETDLPMIDVAMAVGIDDQSYFSRFFKHRTGMTPSEFRHRVRQKH